MAFPTFNLATCIAKQNSNSTEKYPETETFGFPFFEPKTFELIEEFEKAINESDVLKLFTEEEQQQKIRDWKEKRKNGDLNAISLQDIKYFMPIVIENKYFKNLCHTLNQESFWKDKQHLQELKKLWFEQAQFCQVSHECLYIISQRLLALERHLMLAREMLPHSSVPKLIRESYSNYLETYLQELARLKKSIANSMQFRMLCFSEGRDTLPIHYIYDRVQCYLNKNVRIVRENILKEKDYLNFEAYLQQHSPEKLLALKTHLPNKIRDLIPKQSPRYSRIFQGKKYRHAFLQNKSYLLLQIAKNQDKHHYYFHWHAFPQGLNTFNEMIGTLDLCQKYMIPKPSLLQSFKLKTFQRKTRRFNHAWNEYLMVENQNCLNTIMSFLKVCVTGLEKESEFWGALNNVSWDKVSKIREVLDVLRTKINLLPKELKQSFSRKLRLLRERFQYCEAKLQLLNKMLINLSKGVFAHEDEINVLAQLLKQMQIEKPYAFETFILQYHDLWMMLIKHIKVWINSKNLCTEKLSPLLSLVNIIKPEVTEKLYRKVFYRYLFQIISLDNQLEQLPDEIIKLEKLLLEYANNVRVGAKTIAQQINLIHQNNPDNLLILTKISAQSLFDVLEDDYQRHRLEKDTKKYDEYLFTYLSKTKYGDDKVKLALWKKVHLDYLQGKSLLQSLQVLNVAEQLYIGLLPLQSQNDLQTIENLFHKSKLAHDEIHAINEKTLTKIALQNLARSTKNIQTSKRFGLFAKPLILPIGDFCQSNVDKTMEALTLP